MLEQEFLEFVEEQKIIFNEKERQIMRLKAENVEFKKYLAMAYTLFRMLDVEISQFDDDDNNIMTFIISLIERGRTIFSSVVENEIEN